MWYLYAMGNVSILSDVTAIANAPSSSVILLGSPTENSFTKSIQSTQPVQFEEDGKSFTIGQYTYNEATMGIIYLGPYQSDQLALTVAGTSTLGNQLAYKSLPIFTG